MYADHTVGVVVPAYNEAAFVGDVVRGIPDYVDRVYVVDDDSTDDTWDETLAAAAADVDGEPPDGDGARPGSGVARPDTRGSNGWGGRADPGTVVCGTDRSGGPDERTDGGTAASDADGGAATRPDAGPGGATAAGRSTGTAELQAEWDLDAMDDGEGFGAALAERADAVVRRGRVVAVSHRENRGAGGAIVTGYLAALVDGVDAVATIDGDGQMDPTALSALLDPVVEGTAGYAKGDRLSTRAYRGEMPGFRLLGNRVLTFLTRIASGYWGLMDPQNGYTVVSREALRAIGVRDMYEGYGYCNEVLVRLNVAGVRVADVPTSARYADEESHISYSSYIPRVSLLLLRSFLWRLKSRYLVTTFHPLVLFYASGIAVTGVGLLGGLYTLLAFLTAGAGVALGAALSTVLVLAGWLFLLFGLTFDRLAGPAGSTPATGDRAGSGGPS